MRQRYRFYACPDGDCPKLRSKPGDCPEHGVAMREVILRREDSDEVKRIKAAADKLRETGRKMGAGNQFEQMMRDMFKGTGL
jgi:hypothetical protein